MNMIVEYFLDALVHTSKVSLIGIFTIILWESFGPFK